MAELDRDKRHFDENMDRPLVATAVQQLIERNHPSINVCSVTALQPTLLAVKSKSLSVAIKSEQRAQSQAGPNEQLRVLQGT